MIAKHNNSLFPFLSLLLVLRFNWRWHLPLREVHCRHSSLHWLSMALFSLFSLSSFSWYRFPVFTWHFRLTLRIQLRKKYKRIYEPRTFIATIPEGYFAANAWKRLISYSERTEPLSGSMFSWILPLLKSPDPYIIDHSGLVWVDIPRLICRTVISFFATSEWWWLFSWWDVVWHSQFFSLSTVQNCQTFLTIATGGGGQTGLDIISFSNIVGNKDRYFAHVFVGWFFIGLHLTASWLICRLYAMVFDSWPPRIQEDASRILTTTGNILQNCPTHNSTHFNSQGYVECRETNPDFRSSRRKSMDQSQLQDIGKNGRRTE